LVRTLLAGITAGLVVGALFGFRYVVANHYLREGYPQLALDALRSSVNRYALAAGLLFALIQLTYFLFSAAPGPLRQRLRGAFRANALLWLLVIAGLVLWAWGADPSISRPGSKRGLALCAAVTLVVVWLCRFAMRHRARVRRALRASLSGLGGPRTAGIALVLLAGVNLAAALDLSSDRSASDRSAPGGQRPNILLITIDTLRADHLRAYGYARPTSPNIDRLAREGVLFRRAISQWPITSPSFASMMSSTYGHTNGLIRTTAQRMPDRFLTIAELLKAGGYSTWAAVGNVNLARVFNFDQGFDTYREVWRVRNQWRTEQITHEGLDLLDQASKSRPFFLWLHYFDPHARYEPPAPFNGMFVGDAHYDPRRRAPLHAEKHQDVGGIPAVSTLGREDRIAYYVAQYDAEIRYVDYQVGLLLQALRARGLEGKTLVVLTADHGESLGDHNYFFDHGRFPYDDCLHVPLILRGPGSGAAGRTIASPVQLIDLMPTLLDAAGLPPYPEAEGKDLRRLLAGDRVGGPRWDYAFSESGFAQDYQRTITSERYKLVYVPDAQDRGLMKGSELELYDLAKDPGETRNLIHQHPEVAAPLKQQLGRWLEAAGPGADAPEEVRIDARAEEQLRSLGYVE
jgi:arylsulfatase A-like enzyme